MENEKIRQLCRGYLAGSLLPQDLQVFTELVRNHDVREVFKAEMLSALKEEQYPSAATESRLNSVLNDILRKAKSESLPKIQHAGVNRRSVIRMGWVRYAAAIMLFLAAGVYYLANRTRVENPDMAVRTEKPVQDVAPGGNKAILTLADGSTIVLDDAGNGLLASQAGASIRKTEDGRILYVAPRVPPSGEIVYNTITTPRGGQYQLVLADGTHVWLNAASTFRFPTVFVGGERKVELAGEGYFEVAKDAAKPFVVTMNDINVRVLGTHFNVNGYHEEASVNTTLLEGSVAVSMGGRELVLTPGQQGRVEGEKIELAKDVDLHEVMAWKNGLFVFNGASVETIMRQIGRWYDMEIEYEKSVPGKQLRGKASRHTNLSSILKVLEINGVHSRIEGKKIIVKP